MDMTRCKAEREIIQEQNNKLLQLESSTLSAHKKRMQEIQERNARLRVELMQVTMRQALRFATS